MVDHVDRPSLALSDHRRHLGLDPPTLQLEASELLGEGGVVELPECVDNSGQHEFLVANT